MSMTIGIDPHKGSHTTVAIDGDEHPVARLTVPADRCQTQRLLAWAEPLGVERTWAIESATGLGRLLAQQLVAAGENVVDVPATRQREYGCSARPRPPRTIPTTPSPPPSPGCATAGCVLWPPTSTPRWFACSPTATRR